MAATTHPDFNAKTEGLEVTEAFKDMVVGKTILVTGVNKGGIGFATSYALVGRLRFHESFAYHILTSF